MGSRVLGIDIGRRRVGLAISDATRTLARPLSTIVVAEHDIAERMMTEIAKLSSEEDGLSAIVIGVPVRLDGSANEQTAWVRTVIGALKARTSLPIIEADERLTSHEAESRLAIRERDWKKRKERLDAAAAAVILQEYLDRQ